MIFVSSSLFLVTSDGLRVTGYELRVIKSKVHQVSKVGGLRVNELEIGY